jgi:predicted transposase/invertase (TIGR01784 family)
LPEHEDTIMTIAEQLREEGRREGLQKGMLEGIQLGEQRGIQLGEQRGRQEGKLAVARTMLANGIDRALVIKMTGLSEAELQEIPH